MALKYLITGGAGFIGSAVVRALLSSGAGHEVTVVDKLTYAGNLSNLASCVHLPGFEFVNADVCDGAAMLELLRRTQPDIVMHLAAESHVDRSIEGPGAFIQTNIVGAYSMLQASLEYWRSVDEDRRATFRFHHVSTDEVYGSLGPQGLFEETSRYSPNSPYAASKAASDHLVRAWSHTYGLPVIVSNCSNNYGPYQFPEKLIPHMILCARDGRSLPVYGSGENIRDWLYVEDHAAALQLIAERGIPGETYNVGGNAERSNLDVVRAICAIMDEAAPCSTGRSHADRIAFVEDRPGHDLRYAIDASKIVRELGWKPAVRFEEGLRRTVEWYLANAPWWQAILNGEYRIERLGLGFLALEGRVRHEV